MRLLHVILSIGLLFALTACPVKSYETDKKKLQDNGMDFPDLNTRYYEHISFELTDLLEQGYDADYVLTDNAMARVNHTLGLHFSVEKFDMKDAEALKYAFDGEPELIDVVHDNYIISRQESLDHSSTSVKKPVPESVSFPGYIQVVHSSDPSYGKGSSYFTATLQIGDEFYVFQLIGVRTNMGYLYDDFIDLLSSVEQ